MSRLRYKKNRNFYTEPLLGTMGFFPIILLGCLLLVVYGYAIQGYTIQKGGHFTPYASRTSTPHTPSSPSSLTSLQANARFRGLLGGILTYKGDIRQDKRILAQFYQAYSHLDCNSAVHSTFDYNICQESLYLRADLAKKESLLATNVNNYNAQISNSNSIPGIDPSLPRHVLPDGSF